MRNTFTPSNTIVIASSVSNGGGSAVRAAEQDEKGLIDGVAVSEPNVNPVFDSQIAILQGDDSDDIIAEHSRSLYDYTTALTIYQSCANRVNLDAPFNFAVGFADARCQSLIDKGLLGDTSDLDAAATEAQKILNDEFAIQPEQNIVAPSHWFLSVAQAVAVTYANSYSRSSVLKNLCGYSFGATGDDNGPAALSQAANQAIFGTGNGIPPTGGISVINNLSNGGPLLDRESISPSTLRKDENLDGALCLRSLNDGEDLETGARLGGMLRSAHQKLRMGIRQIRATGRLRGKPTVFVTGRSDAILPINHTSRPYYALNQRREGRHSEMRYYEVLNAQHLDVLNGFGGFSDKFIPLHHYLIKALNLVYARLTTGAPLPPSQVVRTIPRGIDPDGSVPDISTANVPDINPSPPPGDLIAFDGGVLGIPD